MKKAKFLALALSLVLCFSLLAACGSAPSGTGGVTVTDMTGREITLDAPATRVVALTAADCEVLYALGAGDTLVGRGEYCDYPAEVLEVTVVQSGYDTNIEQIIELAPQVVLMATMAQPEEQVQQLEDAGIRVVVSDAQDIEGVYTAIEMIGAIVGKDAEAATLVGDMKAEFSSIRQQVPDADEERTIYFEISPLEYGLWTAGSNTFMNELAEMMNVTNIFADLDGWAEISQEQVIERDPDIIITITMYFGEGPEPVDEITGRDGWSAITAVSGGQVFQADNNEISRPGPRLVNAAAALYGFIYGNAA